MPKTPDEYLREVMRGDRYVNYTNDHAALPAFRQLESLGFVRVIDRSGEAPGLWRLAQSSEQKKAARKHLSANSQPQT